MKVKPRATPSLVGAQATFAIYLTGWDLNPLPVDFLIFLPDGI